MNSNNATRCAAFRAQSHNSFRYIIFEMSKTLHEKISCWVIRPWQANQLVSAEKSPRNRAEAAKKWGVHVVRAAKNFATIRRAYQKRTFLSTEHHEIINIQIWSYDESSKIFQWDVVVVLTNAFGNYSFVPQLLSALVLWTWETAQFASKLFRNNLILTVILYVHIFTLWMNILIPIYLTPGLPYCYHNFKDKAYVRRGFNGV